MISSQGRAALLLVVIAMSVSALVAAKGTSPVLPPDSRVEGRGYAELSADWWVWALGQDERPYLDPDGRLCAVGQRGKVWYLAGTNGQFNARRTCDIPEGKYLFLPVINMFQASRVNVGPNQPFPACRKLQEDASVNNDHLVSAIVFIDDIRIADVKKFRVRSKGCFNPYPQLKTDDSVRKPIAASDGYWLLIAPLAPGRHTIRVGANYGGGDEEFGHMVQNFEYEIWIGEEGRITAAPLAGRPWG